MSTTAAKPAPGVDASNLFGAAGTLKSAENTGLIKATGSDETKALSEEFLEAVNVPEWDLSDEQIEALLKKAEAEMRTQRAPKPKPIATTFPRLDPGPLLDAYLKPVNTSKLTPAEAAKARFPVSQYFTKKDLKDLDSHFDELGLLPSPNTPQSVLPKATSIALPVSADASAPSAKKKAAKKDEEKNAGSQWFDMPRTNLTPEVKRDLQLLKMRQVLDPHRHYKQDTMKGFPKFSQMGTVIEGNTEYFSSRLTNRERKQTILEEVLSSEDTIARFKRKQAEIDIDRRSGKKAHYKKVKARRSKN
ncbi:Fcf2 pre-rRNA processing-domain-containing protein [Peziza echinospora]|nr:Fcf2 pre-rRNA processing-domain-containing protein [Peziza echinospora]